MDGSNNTNIKTGQFQSSADSINGRDHYLKQLNNLSHKISKPIINKKPNFDHHNRQPPLPSQPQQTLHRPQQPPPAQQQPPQQPQPRVYNINKNDFRDVVQRLTGSPARDSFSTPPPIQPPKPPSSRLQRIRPPPLAQVSNRPPSLMNSAVPPVHQIPPPQQPQPPLSAPMNPMPPPAAPPVNGFVQRPPPPPPGPLSPYLPSPAFQVAESPVSVYMRYLQNSICYDSNTPPPFSGFSPLAPLVSPRWNNLAPQQQQINQQQQLPPPQQQQINQQQPFVPPPPHPGMVAPSPPPQFQIPNSPGMQFGFLNSPKSPYPLLSPSLLLSPYSFPLSPTVPLPSPGWRGL